MGTSTRNTSKKIKKILDNLGDDIINIDAIIPDVTRTALKAKKAKAYFSSGDFEVLVGGGFASFKKLSVMGYDNFVREYDINPSKITPIDSERIIETILDKIENEANSIESSLLLESFKISYTMVLLNKITDPLEVVILFLETTVKKIIENESKEEITSKFHNKTPEEVSTLIGKYAKTFVQDKLRTIAEKYVAGIIDTKAFISKIQETINNY